MGETPDVLGITYDLCELMVAIKEQRKKETITVIDTILEKGKLESGLARKLKGVFQLKCWIT